MNSPHSLDLPQSLESKLESKYPASFDIREIRLYKHHIPLSKDKTMPPHAVGNDILQAYTFGYYDWMEIREVNRTPEGPYRSIWAASKDKSRHLRGVDNVCSLFAVADGPADSRFWARDAMDLPYLFVSRIYLHKKERFDAAHAHLKQHLQKALDAQKNDTSVVDADSLAYSLYASIDCSDFFVFFRASNYASVQSVIVSLAFEKDYLEFAYTMGGWDSDLFATNAPVESPIYERRARLLRHVDAETFDGIRIEAAIHSPSSFLYWHSQIQQRLERGGCTVSSACFSQGFSDGTFYIKDIPSRELLSLYTTNGLMNPGCDDFRAAITDFSTHLLQVADPSRLKQEDPPGPPLSPMTGKLMEQWLALLEELRQSSDKGDLRDQFFHKAVFELLNLMMQLEKVRFAREIFVQAYEAVEFFLTQTSELLKQENHHIWEKLERPYPKEQPSPNVWLQGNALHEALDFITSWTELIAHTFQTEGEFLPNYGQSMLTFEHPAKLGAFYTAYFLQMIKYLKSGGNDTANYAFMLVPTLRERVWVNPLYSDRSPGGDRLLIASVPSRRLFSPKCLLIILTHECAHFVGAKTRNRAMRFRLMLDMLAAVLSGVFIGEANAHNLLSDESKRDIDRLAHDVAASCRAEANQYLAPVMRTAKTEAQHLFLDETSQFCHTAYLNVLANNEYIEKICDIIIDSETCTDGSATHDGSKSIRQRMQKKRRSLPMSEAMFSARDRLLGISRLQEPNPKKQGLVHIVHLKWYADVFAELFSECHADIVSIFALNLSLKDYLQSFLYASVDAQKAIDSIVDPVFFERLYCVIKTMLARTEENGKLHWAFENVKWDIREEGDQVQWYGDVFSKKLLERFKQRESLGQMRGTPLNKTTETFFNPQVSDSLQYYLTECYLDMEDRDLNDTASRELQSDLHAMYRLAVEPTSGFDMIRNLVDTARKHQEKILSACGEQ